MPANDTDTLRVPRSLCDLARETLRLSCGGGELPCIERLCFADRWAVVQLTDGRAGRAFLFNGAHAVYGVLDLSRMRACGDLIGRRVDDALAWALRRGSAVSGSDAHEGEVMVCSASQSMLLDGSFASAFASLKGSVALAIVNALASALNAPSVLSMRGFEVLPEDDRSFLRGGDRVVLIGAGMLLRESAERCAHVDVVDMRPRSFLQSVVLDAGGVRFGPSDVAFHGVEDTERLVRDADVVGITGCALENETLFEISRLPSCAREFVVFGPSAQAPMEVFASLGATLVLTSRIVDVGALFESVLGGLGVPRSLNVFEGYLARVGSRED